MGADREGKTLPSLRIIIRFTEHPQRPHKALPTLTVILMDAEPLSAPQEMGMGVLSCGHSQASWA